LSNFSAQQLSRTRRKATVQTKSMQISLDALDFSIVQEKSRKKLKFSTVSFKRVALMLTSSSQPLTKT
jgi:hypothetical protein